MTISAILNGDAASGILSKLNQLITRSNKLDTSKPAAQTATLAEALTVAAGLSAGEKVEWFEYTTDSGGGNTATLVDAGSAGARPTEDGGSIFHVGNDGLYLKAHFTLNVVHAAQFGANSGTTAEEAAALIKALTFCKANNRSLSLTGIDSYITPDTFSVGDNEKLSIYSDTKSKIIPTGTGDWALTLQDAATFKSEGIHIDASAVDCGGIFGSSTTAGKYIDFTYTGGKIDVSGSNKGGIRLLGFKSAITIRDVKFYGNPTPSVTGNLYDLQTLLTIPDNGEPAGDKHPVVIDACRFEGGALQYSTFGTSAPTSPLYLTKCTFVDAYCRAIHAYHGEDSYIAFNLITGCKCKASSVPEEAMRAAVWLDQYSPLVDDSREGQVYMGNIVRKCYGAAMFMEEVSGLLSGWTITDIYEYPDGETYTNNNGWVTTGGFGIVITGGSRRITITARVDGCRKGVVIDHALGVSTKPTISVLELLNCNIDQNFEEGVLLRNDVRIFHMQGGTCIGNGRSASNTYDAIRIERDGSDTLGKFLLHGVKFTDEINPVVHRHCVGKGYPGLVFDAHKNIFDSMSQWVNSGGTVSANIDDNQCLNSRGFLLSGTERWYRNNDGFRSEYSDKFTVSNGFIEWTYPTLHAGSAQRVSAPAFLGGADIGRYELELFTNKLSLRLFDSAGVQLTTDVDVCMTVASSKSKAL